MYTYVCIYIYIYILRIILRQSPECLFVLLVPLVSLAITILITYTNLYIITNSNYYIMY